MYSWGITGVYVLTTLECILDSILYMNNLLRISLMNNNQNDCKFAKKAQDALIQYKGRKKRIVHSIDKYINCVQKGIIKNALNTTKHSR